MAQVNQTPTAAPATGSPTTSDSRTFDLSVVISTHDRPAQLREAIASVRDQTHPGPIETIVVWDKAEPDLSLAVDDPLRPVRVMANDRTPGLPGSRNAGAAVAAAPVLGFCDDDDLWRPGKVARQLALLDETGAAVCVAGVVITVDDRSTVHGPDEVLRFHDLLRSRRVEGCMQAVLVRREQFWGDIGPLDEHIPGGYAEDYDWILRAARHGDIPVVVEPMVEMRWIVASHFRLNWPDWEAALGQVLERNPEFSSVPAGRARVEGQIAFAIAGQGRRREALSRSATAWRLSWREPRAYLAAAVALGVPAPAIVRALNQRGRGI
ncbi:MAG: wfgD [Acidimicrobiales bacterium]|nr:wfgD [Acidimicrobiales bacterium]